MTSLYSTIAPHFTQDLLTPGLKVGYTDEGGVWQFLAPSLAQRLPLRAIEWRNLMGVTKFIDKLPLNFVAAETQRDELPLVCIYLVKCEESEAYKSTVKARLGAWTDAMNAAKVEWMVLYVPLGTRRAKAGAASRSTPNAVYKKIFDKIRADFAHKKSAAANAAGLLGVGGAATGGLIGGAAGSVAASLSLGERICKIDTLEGSSVIGQQQQHESQWSELLLRLRHCIMDAFQIKCFQYEEELRVLDAKRATPGWDFGAFFLAKERLALMYQQMYLQDDAIRHLDELDAIFVNLSDAERRTFNDPNAISLSSNDAIFTTSPLALDLGNMQRAIAANRVSARVILLYSFCRQIRTLYLMGNFPQLLQRSLTFIASFLRQLRALHETTGLIEWHQPFQWAVGACLEIAYASELSWSGHDYQVSSASVPTQATQAITPEAMSRHLGDVLYLARRVLRSFAAASNAAGYSSPSPSPSGTPTTSSPLPPDENAEDDPSTPWYEWLRQVFESRMLGERYERCVWEMSHLASLHFSRAGRHRFAVFLGGECARYHVRHREFESASRLFRSHARQCEEDKWWVLFGDCVRHICSAELALGRSGQAVAACFSMLQVAQEEKAELGRDYLDQLMNALVESLESQEHEDAGEHPSKMNMGELIRPKVSVETMQSPGSELDHGEIRVSLNVTNRFPAGILAEKLRVRFAKVEEVSSSGNDAWHSIELGGASRAPLMLKVQGQDNAPRLDSFALEEEGVGAVAQSEATSIVSSAASGNIDSPLLPHKNSRRKSILDETFGEAGDGPDTDAGGLARATDHPHASQIERDESNATHPSTISNVSLSSDPGNDGSAVLLEESNVYLHERASVDLEFLQAGIPVGYYVCTGVECVLAGNTFCLFSATDLDAIRFEVAKRESTLHIELVGPPVLVPGSKTESVHVLIHAREDRVTNGVLEVQVVSEECSGASIRLRRAKRQSAGQEDSAPEETEGVTSSGVADDSAPGNAAGDRLLIPVAAISPGETLAYTIEVEVEVLDGDPRSNEDGSIARSASYSGAPPEVMLAAQIRYQHEVVGRTAQQEAASNDAASLQTVESTTNTTEIRRAESWFRVFLPLVDRLRLKRVGSLVFVGLSLTCNDQIGVGIRDYRLMFRNQEDPSSDQKLAPKLAMDPNASLRGTTLRPHEAVHLAFTLEWPTNDGDDVSRVVDNGQLVLDVDYLGADASSASTTASLPSRETGIAHRMRKTLVLNVPLEAVQGPLYRIDVTPKKPIASSPSPSSATEFAAGDDITFVVRVSCTEESATPQGRGQERRAVLYLDERQDKDWIVIGKQSEAFSFKPAAAPTAATASGTSGEFVTQKRLLATRVGKLRFPPFRLQIDGQDAPVERVLYAQSERQVEVA